MKLADLKNLSANFGTELEWNIVLCVMGMLLKMVTLTKLFTWEVFIFV